MATLYYGNGQCSIEGKDIMGVQIQYKGSINIEDKTSIKFIINHKKNNILIFPIAKGTLNELFDYEGNLEIKQIIVSDIYGKKVYTDIKKVMDYAELLGDAESITTNSENLTATYTSSRKIKKTSLKQQILPNLHTNNWNIELYDINGDLYVGKFHIHLNDNNVMTGSEHTDESTDLYYINKDTNELLPTKNINLIPRKSLINRVIKKSKIF